MKGSQSWMSRNVSRISSIVVMQVRECFVLQLPTSALRTISQGLFFLLAVSRLLKPRAHFLPLTMELAIYKNVSMAQFVECLPKA